MKYDRIAPFCRSQKKNTYVMPNLYSSANDPGNANDLRPQMIPGPEMIPLKKRGMAWTVDPIFFSCSISFPRTESVHARHVYLVAWLLITKLIESSFYQSLFHCSLSLQCCKKTLCYSKLLTNSLYILLKN